MSTIYKPNGSAYWWGSVGSGNDRTRFSLKVRHNGQRNAPKQVWELLAARELQIQRQRLGLSPGVADCKLSEFFNEYVLTLGCRGSSQKRYGHIGESFCRWVKAHDVTRVSEVTERIAQDYLNECLRDKSSGTAKYESAFLSRAWEWAKKRNYAQFTHNPFYKKIKVIRQKRSFFTPDEIAKIYAAKDWPQWLHTACRIAHGSGLRIDSILGLTWGDVDLSAGVMKVRKSKTDAFEVPLLPEVVEHLVLIIKNGSFSAPYTILPETVCHRPTSYLSQEFSRRARALGIPRNKTFHCWRHTFISELAGRGVDKQTIMHMANHKSAAVNDIYVHLDARKLAQDWRK